MSLITRRSMLAGLFGGAAAVVRASSLMPVKAIEPVYVSGFDFGSGDFTVTCWMRHTGSAWEVAHFEQQPGQAPTKIA